MTKNPETAKEEGFEDRYEREKSRFLHKGIS